MRHALSGQGWISVRMLGTLPTLKESCVEESPLGWHPYFCKWSERRRHVTYAIEGVRAWLSFDCRLRLKCLRFVLGARTFLSL